MLAQNNFIQSTQGVASISTLDLNSAIDSIFIIKSLLIAIVKDSTFISSDAETAILTLLQEIFYLEKQDNISEAEFFYIDTHFYSVLTKIKGFHRLADILLQEKSNVDRILRLFLNGKESYMPIIKVYSYVLCGIKSGNFKKSLNALYELSEILKKNVTRAQKDSPEFFPN